MSLVTCILFNLFLILQEALKQIPNDNLQCTVYLFTDASASDVDKATAVQKAIAEKGKNAESI